MTYTRPDAIRIISIDPCHRGVGFVVLEGPDKLVDWGVRQVSSKDTTGEIRHVEALLKLYRPQALVVEDTSAPGCRLGDRAKRIIAGAAAAADTRRIEVDRRSRKDVYTFFADLGAGTKYQIAAAVSVKLPALARHLPPIRKPWMSEDPRMSIFDAAALALTSLDARLMAAIPF